MSVLYYAFSFGLLWLIAPLRQVWGETNLPPLLPALRLVINLIYLNLAAAYFLVLRQNVPPTLSRTRWGVIGLLFLSFVWMHPVFSGDVRDYLMKGRILAVHHQNPYAHVPDEFSEDPLYAVAAWRRTPEVYGPVAVGLEALPVLLFGDSVPALVAGYKLLTVLFLALGIAFFLKLTRRLARSDAARVSAAFALNPLLLVSTVIDGHNDVVLIALVIGAFYFLFCRRFYAAGLLWAASFLVKYVAVLTLPFFVLLAFKLKRRDAPGLHARFFISWTTMIAAVIFLAYAPFLRGVDMWGLLYHHTTGWELYSNTLPYLVARAIETAGLTPHTGGIKLACGAVFIVAAFCLIAFYARRRGTDARSLFRCLSLLHVGSFAAISAPLQPWYLLWGLPWLVLSGWPLAPWLLTVYSFAGLFSYCKRMNFLLILAVLLYAGGFVIRHFYRACHARRQVPA